MIKVKTFHAYRINWPLLLLTWFLGNLLSIAQAEPLVTDRPDATESSSVVGPNTIQLETGMSYAEDDSEVSREFFGTLLRYGLGERLEARFVWGGFFDMDTPGPDGIGDAEVGFKYFIRPEKGSAPETALIVHTTIPLGKEGLTTGAYDPSFLLSFSHSLSESSFLGYNVGASQETSSQARGERTTLASLDYSVVYGFDLTASTGAYLEIFGSQGLSAVEDPIHLDGGFTFLLDEDTQFDLFAGVGLNEEAADWLVGLGFSKRWR